MLPCAPSWFCVLGALRGERLLDGCLARRDYRSTDRDSPPSALHRDPAVHRDGRRPVVAGTPVRRRIHAADDGAGDRAGARSARRASGVGLLLFAASLRQFAVRGKGTLAPWDPPKHLVVEGPYRYVRNPMISGVLFVLLGEALVLRSMAARVGGHCSFS